MTARLARLAFAFGVLVALSGCQTTLGTRPDASGPDSNTPATTDPAPGQSSEADSSAVQKRPRKPKRPTQPPTPKLETVAPTASPQRGAEVFQRLVQRLADPPCVEDRVVQRWEKLYAGYPPRFAANLETALPLMALVLEEIETHGLPGEFALLPIVESWYRPDAAHAGAAGMWQFTASTARLNGLRVQPGFDERLAPQAATRAAMRFLGTLYNRFGDWKLADMAFNAGDHRLGRAIGKQDLAEVRASARLHLPPGLSMTTYEHLAKMQALACIIARPERFKLTLPNSAALDPLRITTAPRDVSSIEVLAQRAGLAPADLRRLNPAFPQGRIAASVPRDVLMPASALARLQGERLSAIEPAAALSALEPTPQAAAPREYLIKRGDTLSAIAQRVGVALRDLLRWNGLDARALLHPGQRLRLEP